MNIPQHGSRFRDALAIVDPGACNPSGVANSIVDACREIREHEPHAASTDEIRGDAAVRLMTHQLAFLITGLTVSQSLELYKADIAHCKRRLDELGMKPFGA
jgi:hypothetical protein